MDLHPHLAHAANFPRTQLDDMAAARKAMEAGFAALAAAPIPKGVTVREHLIGRNGAPDLRVRIYTPSGDGPLPAIVYFHGGAFIMGNLELCHSRCLTIAAGVRCVVISVDYRLAPEFKFPAPVEDCYDGLVWASKSAAELGVDVQRLGVGGESAGGALAAAVTLMARDRKGPPIAHQMLFYPVLDDRLSSKSMNSFTTVWDKGLSAISWRYYLGENVAQISAYAAPARAKTLAGLPAAFIIVGGLDPLRDENIAYAQRLQDEDVAVELHIIPGVPHGFDVIAPDAAPTARSMRLMVEALSEALAPG